MRIKLDENLPVSLAVSLVERGHDVETVLRPGDQSARATRQLALVLVDEHDLEDLAGTVAIA